MTRKDYVALAAAIAEARERTRTTLGSGYVLSMATVTIANALAADNPRFDRGRFFAAAGAPADYESPEWNEARA
ncbi:MAG TPA: hypothetical protein VNC18_17490 [Gemmatimonadaceae bacterium]|nr:hypothetical protein [Gemmatimonadaceae bacterium]